MHRFVQILAALLGSCFLASVAWTAPSVPDILAPGTKGIRHEYVLLGLDQFPDRDFLLAPAHMNDWKQITEDEPFGWYHLMSARIYACPKGTAPHEDAGDEWLESLPMSGFYNIENSVHSASNVSRLRTTLQVVAVTDTEVQIKNISEQYFDGSGAEVGSPIFSSVITPLLLVVSGIALLFILVRLRSRTKNA